MARKQKQNPGGVTDEMLDALIREGGVTSTTDLQSVVGELKKALVERMLNAEMDVHLASEGEQAAGNHRNGTSPKTVLTDQERLVLDIPRDRHGRFDPELIAKYQRRFPGFDDKIVSMYASGMSTRDIQRHILEIYGVGI